MMSALLLAGWSAAAQRVAPAGNQNPYWVLESLDGTDQAISFWDQGRANATSTSYSWMFGSGTPTWHYAALPNPNPTVNFAAPLTTIDDNRGRLYLSQRGATLTSQASGSYYTSAVYMSDAPPSAGVPVGSARLLADVKGQPEMLLIPTLTTAGMPNSPNIQMFCGASYVLYYEATNGTSTDGNLHARFIKPSGNPPTTDNADNVTAFKRDITCGVNTYTSSALPGSRGAFAVTLPHVYTPVNQRRQIVYVAVGQEDHITASTGNEGIYALVLTEDQQLINGVPTALPLRPLLDPCLCIPPNARALTLAESRLIGIPGPQMQPSSICMGRTAIIGATKATFTTSEIEVTADRKRLAWAGKDGKVYVAALFPNNGALDLSISPNVSAVADFSATGLSATNARINGLEFAPDGSYDLYVTVGTDANSGNGIDGFYKIPSTSTSGISYSAPSRRTNPGVGLNTQWVAQSQIETDRNGLLRLLGVPSTPGRTSSLIAFNPVANSGAGAFLPTNTNSPTVTAKLALNLKNVATDVRRLPRQVDGSDYNFAGHIYGPSYVQTQAYPGNCNGQPAPVPPPAPNATATFAVDQVAGWGSVTYTWSVTPLSGAAPVTGFSNSGSPAQTVTFPTTTGGTYLLRCEIAEPASNCATNSSYISEFTVTTGNGCLPLPQRPTPPPPPVVQVWPIPADDYLTLMRDAEDSAKGATTIAELLDGQGQVRLTRLWQGSALTLPTATLPEGLYVLRVRVAGQPATTRRVSIAHR